MKELLLLQAVALFIFLTKQRVFVIREIFDKHFIVGPIDVYKGTYGFPLTLPFKYGQGVRGDSMSLQTNEILAWITPDGFAVSFKERVNSGSSDVDRWKVGHEVISEHETNKNIVKHSAFFILKLYFFADLSAVVVHTIHVFDDGLREFRNIDKVLARFVEGSYKKFRCFAVQEDAFRNMQMIEAKHNEVGIKSINDGGLIFVCVGKVANVLEYFMFAFA